MHDESQAQPSGAQAQRPLHEQFGSDIRKAAGLDAPVSAFEHVRSRAARFVERYGRKLWWLHSAYALALGVFVVTFAQKGFDRARWLAASLTAAWFVLVYFFRVRGKGAASPTLAAFAPRQRLRLVVMTYVLKNLYQSMLFFLLPFYWKAATFGALNTIYVVLLAACALLSTVDIVFDKYLMRWKSLASGFYGLTLFSSLNLLIPALLPNTRTLWTLAAAGGVTAVVFWTMHIPLRALRERGYAILFGVSIIAAVLLAVLARRVVPPVPMHLSHGAVGSTELRDGRLAMEVHTLHASVIRQIVAITDVVIPGGQSDRLHHVWRQGGREIQRRREETIHLLGPSSTLRLRSSLSGQRLPAHLAGDWTVDVETEDGQLVGRVSFRVIE